MAGTITKGLIGESDVQFKDSGTTRATFTRPDSQGRTITMFKIDGADIQFRTIAKSLDDLVDGGYDVPIKPSKIFGGATNTNGHTVPNIADDTFALLAATQTFTNKTLTSPTVTGGTFDTPVVATPVVTGGTITGSTIATPTITDGTMTDTVLTTTVPGAVGGTPAPHTLYRESLCKGYIRYNSTADTISESYNVDSITHVGVGDTTINWDLDFSGAQDYACVGSSNIGATRPTVLNADTTRVDTVDDAGVKTDATIISVIAFGVNA